MTNKQYDHLFKILIVGDSGVGKTAILTRYCDNNFKFQYLSTVGVDFKPKILTVGEKVIKLQIWDTAGQERFMNITASYFRNTTAILIVYDVNDKDSINKINVWYKEAKDKTGREKPIILFVGNKKDEGVVPVVDLELVKEFARKCGDYKVMECSAKDGIGVNELFTVLIDDILAVHDPQQTPQEDEVVNVLYDTKEESSGCC